MSETLAARAALTLEARHSRFLAQAAPAPSPEAALAFLAEVADAGATHNCWAYRIGSAYRSSDDGEPAGTSGRPILAAIDGQGLDQVMVVVTRWYGGIKLGAGGLVRAYGGSAAECLRTAPRRMLVTLREFALFAGFEDLGAVHAALAATGAQKLEETFDADGVRLRVSVAEDAVEALRLRVRDMTRGRAEVL
jgi:uncharacterized YigZ family protein